MSQPPFVCGSMRDEDVPSLVLGRDRPELRI